MSIQDSVTYFGYSFVAIVTPTPRMKKEGNIWLIFKTLNCELTEKPAFLIRCKNSGD